MSAVAAEYAIQDAVSDAVQRFPPRCDESPGAVLPETVAEYLISQGHQEYIAIDAALRWADRTE